MLRLAMIVFVIAYAVSGLGIAAASGNPAVLSPVIDNVIIDNVNVERFVEIHCPIHVSYLCGECPLSSSAIMGDPVGYVETCAW